MAANDTQGTRGIRQTKIFPLLLLEDFFPHDRRHKFLDALSLVLFFLFAGSLVAFFLGKVFLAPKIAGVFFLLLAAWLMAYFLELFYRSLYFENRGLALKKSDGENAKKVLEISAEAAAIFFHARKREKEDGGDMIAALLSSPEGEMILARAGIFGAEISEFLEARRAAGRKFFLSPEELLQAGVVTLGDLAIFLFRECAEFSEFLFLKGISERDFRGAEEWVAREEDRAKFSERWWSPENLAKIGAIGKDISFGQTYRLAKYAQELTVGSAGLSARRPHWEDEVLALSAALSKSRESNALLVGEDVSGLFEAVLELAREIDAGIVPPEIAGKRMLLLDTNLLAAAMKEKGEFEEEFILLLNEAVHAGNVILVFENFPSFIESARMLGSDALGILAPYISSSRIQIVALAEREAYHRVLAPAGEVSGNFDVIFVKEPDRSRVLALLEDAALGLERRHGVFFSFRAVEEIYAAAENYITEGVMPDKAADLLVEIAPYMQAKGQVLIDKSEVLEFVRFKTHIPVGEILSGEREMLEHLEEKLHERVVGQAGAVSAIADAMRRSRAGVRNPEKPIGSFLFLGPTGVGKTETAKSLAAVFFGDEEKMTRLDMSEYSGADALARLIGTGAAGAGRGTLVMALKNSPYGVLLLDEFEKSSREVRDLFLQVLDEGFFSDAGGHRVNARNAIIIATSNAGSDLIYAAIQRGENTEAYQKYIIDEIIKEGSFRPELLNRFDGTILFTPLAKEDLRAIAKIQLAGLAKRIREERGIALAVTDSLVEAMAQAGEDPQFGARPMARAIKDRVEKIIADKIISGELKTGMSFEIDGEELSNGR